ncbi:MAG: rhodanese-like domain-containing protein [Bdellovibrionales bacterium]
MKILLILSAVFWHMSAPAQNYDAGFQAQFNASMGILGGDIDQDNHDFRSKFAISTNHLAMAIEAKNSNDPKRRLGDQFILVDVRSAQETSISMIPSAISLRDFKKFILENKTSKLWKSDGTIDSEIPVILYCTTGYRAFEQASSLINKYQVTALAYGGVGPWVVAGNSFVREGQETKAVHLFDKKFKAAIVDQMVDAGIDPKEYTIYPKKDKFDFPTIH